MEQLGSLQITEEASDEYKQTTTEEMLVVPVLAAVANSENVQAGLPKNIVMGRFGQEPFLFSFSFIF